MHTTLAVAIAMAHHAHQAAGRPVMDAHWLAVGVMISLGGALFFVLLGSMLRGS